MLSALRDRSINMLDTIVTTLEQYDDTSKRPNIFGYRCMHKSDIQEDEKEGAQKRGKKGQDTKKQEAQDAKIVNLDELAPSEKFRYLSYELIDIGVHQGQKGLEYIQSTTPYSVLDRNIHITKRVQKATDQSVKMYKFFNDKVYSPMKQNLFVIYDQSSKYISLIIGVLRENQNKVLEYIHKNYENVQVFVKDNWLRLDFNNDGKVSVEDLRKAFAELFDFIRNFEYFNKAIEIKSSLYQEAIKLMKRDLRRNQDQKESGLDEGDEKVERLLEEKEE